MRADLPLSFIAINNCVSSRNVSGAAPYSIASRCRPINSAAGLPMPCRHAEIAGRNDSSVINSAKRPKVDSSLVPSIEWMASRLMSSDGSSSNLAVISVVSRLRIFDRQTTAKRRFVGSSECRNS